MMKLLQKFWPDIFESADRGKIKRVEKFLRQGLQIDAKEYLNILEI